MTAVDVRDQLRREAESSPLLLVEDLEVDLLTERGWLNVVDRVSFEVHRGETLGIVGESGSGKSITSLAIMGLLPTGQARVRATRLELDGAPLLSLDRRSMEDLRGSSLAMIFQEPMTSLNPAFTVGNQIAETVRRHTGVSRRAAKQRAVDLLDLVGIPDARRRVHCYPHELSGGMRQRVMIAIAASCEPQLLIADEPTTALDVTIQAQILDLLRTMNRELGMAVMLITHDLGVVADLCRRVMVMYAGQMVEKGTAVEVFHRPLHPYADALLSSMPSIDQSLGRMTSIPGQAPAAGRIPSGCRFHDRCAHSIEICAAQEPAIVHLGEREVRCHRHTELSLGTAGEVQ